MSGGDRYFVLAHRAGPDWQSDLTLFEQPGVAAHIAFMSSVTERGLMVLGGPYAPDPGEELVGMAVIHAADLDAARAIAAEDESVRAGLLRVSVREWTPKMGSAL